MIKEEKSIKVSNSTDSPINIRAKCASAIFEEYGDFLRAIIYLHIKDKSMVDDIMQNFFLTLVAHPLPDDIEDMKSYLYQAIINDIIDSKRRIQDYQVTMQRLKKIVAKNQMQQGAINEKNLIEREEIAKLFIKIKTKLPQPEADAILNYYAFRKNISAGANKMKVDVRTFSRYVCVGLKKFRQILKLTDSEDI